MLDFSHLIEQLAQSPLREWAKTLPEDIEKGLCPKRYGDLPQWLDAMNQLPKVKAVHVDLNDSTINIGKKEELSQALNETVRSAFEQLCPWRKGPFSLFNATIDTEWRSDFKWDRLAAHITPLKNRLVLDVGCGSGYHCLRMLGEGAQRVIGIDPSPRFVVQFYMLKHFLENSLPADVLPVGIEALPARLGAFDTVFSMGVLYHRISPMEHLRQLKDALKPGGEVVLETLIIKGALGDTLVPEGRYAKMNNVWFIPSADTLLSWMKKCGFKNIRCVDINQTSTKEQRATPWMGFQSLSDFLDPNDTNKTIEGHPAPLRGIFIAEKP